MIYRKGDKMKSKMRVRVVMSTEDGGAGGRHDDEDEAAVSGTVGLSKESK
jgi:hypothetical protein